MPMARAPRPDEANALPALLRTIARNEAEAAAILAASPALARQALAEGATRGDAVSWFLAEIGHHVYAGDTPLHVAAAGHRAALARQLLALHADPAARNRRGATPLHYAADGNPNRPSWDPEAQAATIAALLAGGADPGALDNSGVAPLHRAVRTRCAAAVQALLAGGADPHLPNKSGSTPLALAAATTGRGGSGSAEAKREQEAIVRLLRAAGATR